MGGGVFDLERMSVGVLAFDGGVLEDDRCSRDFLDAAGECFEA